MIRTACPLKSGFSTAVDLVNKIIDSFQIVSLSANWNNRIVYGLANRGSANDQEFQKNYRLAGGRDLAVPPDGLGHARVLLSYRAGGLNDNERRSYVAGNFRALFNDRG